MTDITQTPPAGAATAPSVGDIVRRVLVAVPGFALEAEELVRSDEELTPGRVFSTLAAVVGDLDDDRDLVRRCNLLRSLECVEGLLDECDPDTGLEIGASFLGNLPVTAITSSLLWMGPRTLSVLESLDDDPPGGEAT